MIPQYNNIAFLRGTLWGNHTNNIKDWKMNFSFRVQQSTTFTNVKMKLGTNKTRAINTKQMRDSGLLYQPHYQQIKEKYLEICRMYDDWDEFDYPRITKAYVTDGGMKTVPGVSSIFFRREGKPFTWLQLNTHSFVIDWEDKPTPGEAKRGCIGTWTNQNSKDSFFYIPGTEIR